MKAMMQTLYILQQAFERKKYDEQRVASPNRAIIDACQAALPRLGQMYSQFTDLEWARFAFRHNYETLVGLYNNLYALGERCHTDTLDAVQQLLENYQGIYAPNIDPEAPLPLFQQHSLQNEVAERLPLILEGLAQKGIPKLYLDEIKFATDSLFQTGKLPEIKHYHSAYLERLLDALEQMAQDQRKKNWLFRFIVTLINYNFNYMGIVNRWYEQQDQTISQALSVEETEQIVQHYEITFRRHYHLPEIAFDIHRKTLLQYMRDYVKQQRKALNQSVENGQTELMDGLISDLNGQELTVLFHYSYKIGLLQYPTKREAAKSFSRFVKSKTQKSLSVNTLEKFDKKDLEYPALNIWRKMKTLIRMIEDDFKNQ